MSFRTSNQTPSLPLREYSVFCEKAGRQAQACQDDDGDELFHVVMVFEV